MDIPKIIQIWQPVGFSTHQISKNVGRHFYTKTTHTGTLDPLAQGVIVILLGEERCKKDAYSNYKKGYEFDLAFGLSTDSFDAMGMIEKDINVLEDPVIKERVINQKEFKNLLKIALESFVGPYTQKVPLYSAIKYQGKKLFEWAHAGEVDFELPEKQGTIYKTQLKKLYKINLQKLISNTILKNLKSIVGNFRQEKIITQWENYLSTASSAIELPVARIYVETSRGIYVRSFSQDVCKRLKIPGFVSSLTRTKNGPFQKKDCKTLEKIFGENFDRNKFVSSVIHC